MSNKLSEIFSSLLDEYEKNPTGDVDALIKAQGEKEGLSDDGIEGLNQTLRMVEELHEAKLSLEEAKENGDSREDWLTAQVDDITKGLTDEQKDIAVKAITQAQAKVIDDYAEEVEL